MKIGLLIGLVVVIHHASSFKLGYGCGSNVGHGSSCGCGGIPYNNNPGCPGSDLLNFHHQDDWCSAKGGALGLGGLGGRGGGSLVGDGSNGVPLVVRPHDLPKPALSPIAALDLSKPIPGPCAIKKAIVKPAVLPKPVCKAHHGGGYCGGCHSSCSHNSHSCCSQNVGVFGFGSNRICGQNGVIGVNGFLGPNGVTGINGGIGPNGVRGTSGGYGGEVLGYNGVVYAPTVNRPADPISLDIAYKLAQQNDLIKLQSEDKLNFGFRKLPVELPPRRTVKNNIPEEQIFNLNGQIVELKPINQNTQSATSLAEEAADQLSELQEEEGDDATTGGINGSGFYGPRKPTLGEIGYGAAKAPTPNLIDVPASAANFFSSVDEAGKALGVLDSCECTAGGKFRHISTNCGCGSHVDFQHGSSSCGCGHTDVHAHSCGCETKCKCKIIPGNVEFRTLPKLPQICIPPVEIPDSCESGEIEISNEDDTVHCSCIPVCHKHVHKKSCRKSCINIQKSQTY